MLNSTRSIPIPVILLTTLILILFTHSSAYEDVRRFERISVERGLAHGSVYSIIQDRSGFLWFATGDGLTRFDGYEFKNYRYDPSAPNSVVAGQLGELYQDSRGIIWIGTWGAGLDRFDPESNRFNHFLGDPEDPNSVCYDRVEDIEEDREGNIWAGMEKGGAVRYNRSTGRFQRYLTNPEDPSSLVHNDVKVLYKDSRGDLWIGTNGGISRLIIGKEGAVSFQNYSHRNGDPSSLAGNRVRALCEDAGGRIWVGTRGTGISYFDPSGDNPLFTHIRHRAGDPDSICEDSIASLMLDSEMDIWIGTYNSGLNRYSGKTGEITCFRYDSENTYSLSHNRAEAILEDRSRNLWVGTLGGGVNRLDLKEKKFRNFTYNSADTASLAHSTVRAICELGEEWVIGTEGGLTLYHPGLDRYRHLKNNRNDPGSISGNRIWSVISDRKGALWVGTFSNGLNHIDFSGNRVKVIRFRHDPEDDGSLSHNRIQALLEDSDGGIWAGTSEGLNLLNPGGDFQRVQRFFENPDGSPEIFHGNNYIVFICQGSGGAVWVGTRGGLIKLNKQTGEFMVYRHEPEDRFSLGSNSILTIMESTRNPGIFWIGTADGGLNRLERDSGRFERYYQKDGLPGNEVSGILEDRDGHLWISTNGGLSKFDPAEKVFRNYKRSSGIEGIGFLRNSAFQSSTGEMLFGSISGMVSFFPGRVKDNPHVPEIVITSFRKLGEDVELMRKGRELNEIRLDHNENYINIKFAALDFTNVKENHYSYCLEDVDYGWVNSGSTRSVNYNNLSPGTYAFKVVGSNNDGIWNRKGKTLKIIVTPAFWQTWWFRALLLLSAVLLVIGLYKYRVYNITRTNRKLSELNAELNREIGNRIIAEEALRESELSYRTLFFNANDAIFLLNEGVFHRFNEKTQGIFGFDEAEEIRGQNIEKFSSDVQAEGMGGIYFNHFIEKAMIGKPQRFYWIFKRKDGTLFDAEISLNRLELGNNTFIQVILRDITEQKKMRERLAVTQKMESIGELTGGIAHDFNNILTAMNGYAEMALRSLAPTEMEYRYVRNILKSGNQAVDLVQKLLGFSRQQIISPRIISINDAISALSDMITRLIGEDIEMGYEFREDVRCIKADIVQIEQLLINLIINSRDAVNQISEKGFRKKIHVSTDEIEVGDQFMKDHSGIREGEYVVITVEDNGIGMSPAVQEKIFEPFFTTKGLGKGTGLGLATVYGIVKQNAGAIYVESEEEKGTTVRVYWPVSEEEAVSGGSEVSKDEVAGGNETILFVEDDEAVRELATAILESLGYRVYSASNGIEALKQIEAGLSSIDLLITDVVMPEMGGKELEEKLRKQIPELKVLFASGYTDNYIVHSGVLEEGVSFIHKPFSVESLGNKVREILSG